MQCAYGLFRRDVVLPCEVTVDRAKATYRDGVLRIVLPKVTRAEPRRFSVNVS
ncbi:MAG: Hsp20 family protein [Pseudomonadota bacterium]|nr:Hsp20 family protein [Pseudomonadota bacterium]